VAGVLAIVGIIAVSRWPRAAQNGEKPLIRLSVDLGPDALKQNGSFVAISLDGRNIVYPMRAADGKQQLAMRPLRDAKATLLSGTDNATAPFFSPDGEWIGFFALGQLKKISAHGGAPMNLLPAAALGGGWSEAGEIFVTPSFVSPLMRIPAAGGVCAAVTQTQSGEVTHRWPQALPRGRAVLFTSAASPSAMEDATIQALSLQTGATKILQRSAYYGRYVPSGHLLFVHQGSLYAARFDPDRLEVRGAPAPILDDIGGDPVHGAGQFDVSGAASGSGTLVYREGKAPQGWPLIWVESSGATRPLLSEPGVYSEPRLSPDGQRLAIVSSAMGSDIYVYDWRRDVMTRLTFDGHAGMPIWSPDGKHIVYRSTSGAFGLLWTRADGGGQPEKLLQDPNNIYPTSFSPDGRLLAYHLQYSEPRDDIWILPLDLADPDHPKAGKPRLFLRDPFDNQFPVFSPDGKWIAYRSGESGRWEVYVRPYPGPGGKWQISGDGGEMPYWSKTPRQLFYKSQRARMMVLDYSVEGDSFVPGKPRLWTTARVHPAYQGMDLAPDGRRFAALSLPEEPKSDSGSVHVTFLLNFFDELRRRVP
jgi:serine/threonine-protein kinase